LGASPQFFVTRWTSRLHASRTLVRKPSCPSHLTSSDLKTQLLSCAWVLYSNFAFSPFRRFILDVRRFGVLGAISYLPCLWSPCSLRRTTAALWAILIPAAASSFRGPQFSLVRIFLKMFLLRHATLARRDIFPKGAANFLGIHNLFGSVPLALRVALQLAAGPYAASSLLLKISLRQSSEAAYSEDSSRQRSSKKRGGLVGSHRLKGRYTSSEVL
jgi:hypothetical protein